MTDAAAKQTRFMITQLRTKNIWRELELLAVLIMIIFVSSLLPSLLLRYVYTDPQMVETPPIFEVIPVFSFVLGVAVFVYVIISNMMREMKAMDLEKTLNMEGMPASSAVSTSSSDLQAAMKSLSARTTPKRKTKVVAAQRVTSRTKVKTRRAPAKRKSK